MKYPTKPIKHFGQNFLNDKNVLRKIIKTADLSADDVVLEVGPGTGILTKELVKTAKKVIAVEKDRNLAKLLKETFKDCNNIEIINADILRIFNLKLKILNEFPITQFSNYKVVANIPYYITSPLIRNFLEAENPPQSMTLLVQKEVAQRICSSPPDMNLLAVSIQYFSKPEIISYVSKNSFWPKPKVDSAIIKISNIQKRETNNFFKIAKAGFSQPRKKIINNLSARLGMDKEKIQEILKKAGISPEQRPQTLSVQNWIDLSGLFYGIINGI